MPTMLTLGLPPRRDPRALFDGLLSVRCADPAAARALPSSSFLGPAIVPLSSVGEEDGDLIARLDTGPSGRSPDGIVAARFTVGVPERDLGEVLELRPSAPMTVFCAGTNMVDVATAITRAGHSPGLDAGDTEDRAADVLAVVAHTDTGFFAHAHRPDQIPAIVAGTVAALRGDDIRAALRAPDIGALFALHPDAADATRQVLIGIEVDDAVAAIEFLGELPASADRGGVATDQ